MQCPNNTEPISLNYDEDGFMPIVVGPSEDTADVSDALLGSNTTLTLCDGDNIVLKPKCPDLSAKTADIASLRMKVQGVQSVTIKYIAEDDSEIFTYTENVSNFFKVSKNMFLF